MSTLIEAVATYDVAVDFAYHDIEAWMVQQNLEEPRCELGGWHVGREIVLGIDGAKRVETNLAACRCVLWNGLADRYRFILYLNGQGSSSMGIGAENLTEGSYGCLSSIGCTRARER
jgi:hypothetical protein